VSFRGDADRSDYPVWACEEYASKVPGNAPNSSSVYPPVGEAVLPVWSGAEPEVSSFTTGCCN